MIIGIAGKAGSGKDTVASELCRLYGLKRDTLAAPIKRFVQDVFGVSWEVADGTTENGRLEREKKLKNWGKWTVRKLLQFIGTELMRTHICKNIWVKSLIIRMKKHPETNWIVTDVRFPNEMKFLKKYYKDNFIMLKVVRNNVKEINGIKNHESEAYDLKADYVIENNGTLSDLSIAIDEFARIYSLK